MGSPVASNQRVYLIARWQPVGSASCTHALRLIAMDVRRTVVNRTALIWSVDMIDAEWDPKQPRDVALAFVQTAAGPTVLLSAALHAPASSNALLAIVDNGASGAVLYQTLLSTPTDAAMAIDPRTSPTLSVWVVVGLSIVRFDPDSGDVIETYEHNQNIVSRLLLARSSEAPDADLLVLFVSGVPGALSVAAVNLVSQQQLWTVALPSDLQQYTGQLAVAQSAVVVLATSAGVIGIGA